MVKNDPLYSTKYCIGGFFTYPMINPKSKNFYKRVIWKVRVIGKAYVPKKVQAVCV